MRALLLLLTIGASLCAAQKTTIDLAAYKNKGYAMAQTAYTIGAHVFTLVNIKPLHKTDTACISAIVIDKRKYVLFDVGIEGAATGLIVPRRQPIPDGLVVLKASPVEGKTFVFLSNGKLVTLPGALALADTAGKNIYCVWDNETHYRLTVFDYKNVRVIVPATDIARPRQWYSTGLSFCFSVEKEKGYYIVDMITKSISKTESVDAPLTPVSYLVDFGKFDNTKCCTGQVLKK
jgi:hypothetical protein